MLLHCLRENVIRLHGVHSVLAISRRTFTLGPRILNQRLFTKELNRETSAWIELFARSGFKTPLSIRKIHSSAWRSRKWLFVVFYVHLSYFPIIL